MGVLDTSAASVEQLLQNYLQNPNAIVYDVNFFSPPLRLTFYNPELATIGDNSLVAGENRPFASLPEQKIEPSGRPVKWTLSNANFISGVIILVLFVVLYIMVHRWVLYKYNEVYSPTRRAAELAYFTANYRSLFLTYRYQCSPLDPYQEIPKGLLRRNMVRKKAGETSAW
jgi:hypothetical protein